MIVLNCIAVNCGVMYAVMVTAEMFYFYRVDLKSLVELRSRVGVRFLIARESLSYLDKVAEFMQ